MRVATTPAFSQYLMDNSNIYPYSKLRPPTRNSFYCKWVMLKGQDRGSTERFPVLANSLPSNGVLLELLLSEEAMPFPPELSDIMDSMYWWGRTKNNEWYEAVVYMVEEALDNDVEEDRKELVRALISFQVKAEIYAYVANDSIAAELLWIDWVFWFNCTYKDATKSSFRAMSLDCFEYVHWAIAQVNYHAHAPIQQTLDSVNSA
jgi:hypothetical protein